MAEPTGISILLEKLASARFRGTLTLRMESGAVASARLEHFLPFAAMSGELPTIEPAQMELEPSGKI